MSKLDELIQQLCPDGVVYKEVQDVAKTTHPKGKLKSNDYLKEGKYPVIDQGQNFIGGYTNEEIAFPQDEYVIFGDHTCVVKYVNFPFVQGADGVKVIIGNDVILPRFLYFCMKNIKMSADYARHWSKMKVEKIPLPPLPVQEEIVRLLDQLTETTQKYQAELEAELATRKKQYEEYRNQLLDLEGKEGIEMKTLGEIGEFIRGHGILKTDFVEEGLPCIHYGQIHTKYDLSTNSVISYIDKSLYTKCRKAETGDVILATTSEDVECVAKPVVWLGSEKVAISGDAYIFRHNQIGKFIAHQFLTHNFLLFKKKYATGAKVVRISGDSMAKYEFPLPSLPEQERIVNILDRMDKTHKELCKSIETEIKMRKQQYEYYRNQLLDFKKKED